MSFLPPMRGTNKISAMLAGDNSKESIITVIVTETSIPIIIVSILIGKARCLIITAKLVLKTDSKGFKT